MACTEGNQLPEGDLHATLDKIEADLLQITKKWNWIGIVYQGSFNRKIPAPATNGSSAPKYVHHQGWSLYFKTFPGGT